MTIVAAASARTTTILSDFSSVDIFGCHKLTAAVKEGDHVGVRDRRKNSYSRFEGKSNLVALRSVADSLGLTELDSVATVGKEDECLLSNPVILLALFHQSFKGLDELLPAQISVLSDVFLLDPEAF